MEGIAHPARWLLRLRVAEGRDGRGIHQLRRLGKRLKRLNQRLRPADIDGARHLRLLIAHRRQHGGQMQDDLLIGAGASERVGVAHIAQGDLHLPLLADTLQLLRGLLLADEAAHNMPLPRQLAQRQVAQMPIRPRQQHAHGRLHFF